jgi:hypothetical protein
MRIDELVNPDNFSAKEFDVKEDLIHFMNNEPEFYRKFYYPAMVKIKLHKERGNEFDSTKLAPMINHAYSIYKEKFPVKDLQSKLSKEDLKDVCSKIYETELDNIKQGHYDNKD